MKKIKMLGLSSAVILSALWTGPSAHGEPSKYDNLGKKADLCRRAAVSYYSCKALEEDAPKACSVLAPLGFAETGHETKTWEQLCNEDFRQASFVKSLATRNIAACTNAQMIQQNARAESASQACAVFSDQTNPTLALEKLTPLSIRPLSEGFIRNFPRMLRMFHGDKTVCSEFTEYEELGNCYDYATYIKAYKSRDRTACGENGKCRALMGGDRNACRSYVNVFTPSCRRWLQETTKHPFPGFPSQKENAATSGTNTPKPE